MRILGIDPGLAIVGWGLLDYQGGRFSVVDFGAVRTPAHTKTEDRLLSIYEQIGQIIEKYRPDRMSIEEIRAKLDEMKEQMRKEGVFKDMKKDEPPSEL